VEPAQRQRLARAIGNAVGVPPEQVLQDAITQARHLESYRLPSDAAREISDLQARVDLAAAQFRAGDPQAAASQADVVLDRLRQRPGLPMASSMAWQLHVLRGRIAWMQADDEATESAWRAAIAVDPEAVLSSRESPPDVVASYEAVREQVLSERSAWRSPTFEGFSEAGAQIEIDGVGGARPVPPGEHFVVVHWPGAAMQAAVFDGGPIVLEVPEVTLPAALPRTQDAAEQVCDRLDLDVLVLARLRDGRVGVQAYACGGDFGAPWYSEGRSDAPLALDSLLEENWDPQGFEQERGVLLDTAPWPEPEPEFVPPPETRLAGSGLSTIADDIPARKPWFRRAWIWVVVGGVVAGAVTTGVVLGTREAPSSVVVTDDFLRP